MSIHRHTEWRKRQVILEPELVKKISYWHEGHDAIYVLSSSGSHDLVSLSMIDMALQELSRSTSIRGPARGASREYAKASRELKSTTAELMAVRQYWQEHSAKEAGLESDPDFRYEYDKRDYGLSAADEAEYPTRSA